MVGTARIDITARDGASAVFARVQRSMGELDQRAGKLSAGFAGIGAALGTATLAGAGFALVVANSIRATANFGDQMGHAAQRLGITAESMSRLRYAATQSDATFEQLEQGLHRLGQSTVTNAALFDRLGIATRDSAGNMRASDALFKDVADRFAAMPAGIEKTNLAIALFGRELGPRLLPTLNNGADGLRELGDEAERFGRVVTDEAAASAILFNDNLSKLTEAGTGLVHVFGNAVIPAIARLSTEMLEGQRIAGGFWQALGTFATINPFRSIEGNLAERRRVLAQYEAELQHVPEHMRAQTDERLRADIARLRKQIEFLEGQQTGFARPPRERVYQPLPDEPPAANRGTRAPRTGGSRAPAAARITEAEKYLQALQRQLEAMDELSEREQVLRDIGLGRLAGLTAAQREQALAVADTIDARKLEAEQDRERLAIMGTLRQAVIDEARAVQAANEQWENMLQALVADTAVERTRRLTEQVLVLDEALIAGRIHADQHADAIAKITERSDGVDRLTDSVKDLNLSFTSAFENAVESGGRLRDVISGIITDMARMAFRQTVSQPLSSALNSFIGSIFSFDGGGYTGSGPRSGGLDGRGGYIAMLHPQETVIDHTKGQGAGRSVVVNQSFSFNGPADQALVLTAARMGAAMGRRAIYDDMARGRMA